MSPPGLGKGEAKFVRDLRDFWRINHVTDAYRNLEIFLLRNLPRVGVGFFRQSQFYPDFIVWIRDMVRNITHIQFVEPHGMRLSGGLAGNEDKIEALKELQALSHELAFYGKKIKMGGYLLTETDLSDIPDARGKTREALERDYRLLRQEGTYIQKLLSAG